MPTDTPPTTAVQSVDRALTVLGILSRVGEAGVTQIAAELGVHKSTAFRLVATLEQHGMVEQHEERGKYRLGVGLVRLAAASTARLDVVTEARPVVRELAARTGETVNIAVLSEEAALYVDQVAGASALQSHNWVGQRIPLHATSNGKVLLSALSAAEIQRRLTGLKAYTPATVVSRPRLRETLAEVRAQGYAVAVDEFEPGLTALAAPIRDVHGDVIASLSVSGPSLRMDAESLVVLEPLVREAADRISTRLGAAG